MAKSTPVPRRLSSREAPDLACELPNASELASTLDFLQPARHQALTVVALVVLPSRPA
jgi:hypothetical protein